MGDKTTARELAVREGVAIAPGFLIPKDGLEDALLEQARNIGYPLLIKAAAGGGGRGMRPVQHEGEFAASIESAQREAHAAFGDGRVYVEKLITQPRHIEVQIIADAHGQVAHLFERECSIQRRHQKIIEESPSPFVDAAMRKRLCDAAVKLARAANYVNAGTMEFIVDDSGAIYFLEMNTRLQVEHPVTECVAGVDLVQAQILIATSMPLREAVDVPEKPSGHAIECRICAEDAANGFMPSMGRVTQWIEPRGVRVDAGYSAGDVVSPHYDSLLAKVIAHGATRSEAIAKMSAALKHFHVQGLTTNIDFLRDVIEHPAFQRSETTTHFLQQHFAEWQPRENDDELPAVAQRQWVNPWHQRNRFRMGEGFPLSVQERGGSNTAKQTSRNAGRAKSTQTTHHHSSDHVESPMPAMVRQVLVSAGDAVSRGDALVVLEAMKMEQRMTAPRDGVVKTVSCAAGQSVERGQVLVEFEV
jgi:acetyl/propionyl-CoA carboxylase alpha subunit